MKLNKQDKDDLMQVYNTWWNSYLTGDVKTYDSFLDEEFRFVGSTNNEEFLSRKDTTDFFDATADQLAGKAELRNTIRKIEVLGNGLVLITDLADAYVVGEPEWVFYSRFRFTCLLRKTENGWRFIYQHFSAPDSKAQEGETLGLEQISKENQELRDAIKRRTVELEHKNRELEIETALERVRARTMGMQKGEEVKDVVVLLYKELIKLGVTNFATCGYVEINEKTKRQETWVTNPGGDSLGLFYLPLTGDVLFDERYEAWKKQQVVFHQTVAGKKRREHLEYAITTFNSKEAEEMVLNQFPDPTVFYCFNFSHGYLHLVSGSKLKEEEESLLARFTRVFQQTYTRFLDLQKAEARAREAQIEAALERTRTQSMLMKHSDEMTQLSKIFHEQLIALDIPSEFSYIWLPDEAKEDHMFWATWTELKNKKASTVSKSVTYPLDKTEPYTAACFKAWKSDIPVHVTKIPAEEVAHFFTTWDDLISGAKKLKARYFPEGIYYAESYMKYGCFGINIRRPLSENEQSILQRFTIEFERAYTRFLDLKKAEAQAREAQIELALERVRARTMAMQQSDELGGVATVLFKELNLLVENLWTCGFVLCEKNRGDDEWWVSTKEGFIPAFYLPNTVDVTHENMHKAWESGETYHTEQLEGKALQEHYDWLMNIPASKKVFDEMSANGISLPTWQKLHGAFFSYGYLVMITQVPCPEEAIFKRFAQVFDQTYTRFLDLQKAEAQAREAQIELALERVRARAMSMQKSDELSDLVGTVFTELTKLDFALSWCIINIIDEPNKSNVVWGANTEAGKPPESYSMKFEDHRFHHEMMKAYQERKEKWVFVLEGDEKRNYDDYLFTDTEFRKVSKKVQQEMRSTKRYIASFTFSSFGGLQTIGEEPLSEENLNILNRFGKVFDLTYTRFNDLLKAEAQAREAQIEAALEKVRSHSIGMQKSEELREVIQVIHDQLIHLNFEIDAAGFTLDYHQNNDWNTWIANKSASLPSLMFIPYIDHPQFNYYKSAKEKGLDFLANTLSFEEKNSIFNYMFEYMGDYPQAEKDEVLRKPGLAISQAFLKNISLWIYNLEAIPYSKEDNNTLMRFAKVFQQTYTRFIDLQKAEAQAREAQVELALERIRVQATTMTESSDLLDIVVTMRTEFVSLGHEAHYFWHMRYLPEIYEKAMTSGDGNRIGMVMSLPRHMHGDIKLLADWEKSDEPTVVFAMDTETAVEYIHKMITLGDFKQVDPNAPTLDDIRHIGGLTFIMARTTHGEIGFSLPGFVPILPKEDLDTLVRFASVFDLAYRRFEDLKAAEAQAHEAQIEAALERVRSRSMAMHKSEELADLSFELVKQIQALGVPTWFCAFNIYDDDQKGSLEWGSNSEGTYPSYRTPREGIFLRYYEAGQKGETFLVNEIGENECAAHYDYLCSLPGVGEQLLKIRDTGIPFPTSQIDHVAYFKYGYILFITFEPAADAHEVFKRFANVFEQTYTRFLDLKKAEKQAREAQIETALERVRARAMAMQQPEELKEVAQVLRHEMGLLGVEELETSSIYINEKNAHIAECWYAIKDVRKTKKKLVTDHFALDLNDIWVGREMLKFHKSNKKQISIVMTGESRIEWIRYCEEKSIPLRGYYGDVIPDRTYHLYKFSHGAIGAATPGDFSDENWGLLRRVASVFSLAYSRFKDLTQARIDLLRLKEEKKRAEDALSNLKSTQTQLIHAEKMASLGELTAGIAHEIQNPLNFVNNFSDVSVDLIEEMDEEMTLGNTNEVKDIASDLKQNLEKIHHHGKRASFIVQGMLEHSRTNPGDKKPTDINVLADEFLRLSYHGLRAKDKSFNAEFITEFDDDLPEINVIPQDFGRVLLNLINNAFYACADRSRSTVAEKQKLQKENYKPAVLVSTQKIGDNVEIRVKDNGNGIPNEVLKKIFQPFFTTKPTGEGTGLGLSMSYDIITKGHDGKLNVETKEGEGTTFIINIPILK